MLYLPASLLLMIRHFYYFQGDSSIFPSLVFASLFCFIFLSVFCLTSLQSTFCFYFLPSFPACFLLPLVALCFHFLFTFCFLLLFVLHFLHLTSYLLIFYASIQLLLPRCSLPSFCFLL